MEAKLEELAKEYAVARDSETILRIYPKRHNGSATELEDIKFTEAFYGLMDAWDVNSRVEIAKRLGIWKE
jgi:hypothetical protein